ncbi:MAG TPA: hypothetical protein VGP00_00655 [Nocardioides sp.]|jgi:hypothetical protein|nr:hypothetical protein [Nocardioides sp.]
MVVPSGRAAAIALWPTTPLPPERRRRGVALRAPTSARRQQQRERHGEDGEATATGQRHR